MATKYKRAGAHNWSDVNAWSTTSSAGAANTTVPTSADDLICDAGSGNLTIDTSGLVCRSLNCTGYTATLTHNAFNVNVGDGTAGTGNVALKLVAGMTYTIASSLSATFTFVSTSATVQTVDTAAKTTSSMSFNGAGGSWQFASNQTALTVLGTTLGLVQGTLDTNGKTVAFNIFQCNGNLTRTLTLGSSTLTFNFGGAGAFQNTSATGLTITANTATVVISGAGGSFSSTAVNWNGMTLSYTGSGTMVITATGAFTIAALTVTGAAAQTYVLTTTGPFTVTTTVTFTGNSLSNRGLFASGTYATQRAITMTGATLNVTNFDFRDISVLGSPTVGTNSSVGDAGNNSGLTSWFTNGGVSQDRWAVAAGNWNSTATWATSSGGAPGASVPLCHDNVFMDAASGAGTYVTNQSRACKNLDMTGFTRTLNVSSAISIFGSITAGSGMTWGAGTSTISFLGRGSYTVTSNGKTWVNALSFGGGSTSGAVFTFADDLTISRDAIGAISAQGVTLNDGGKTVTMTGATGSTNFFNNIILLLSGTWNIGVTAAQAFWNATFVVAGSSNMTACTIVLTAASANDRTFTGSSVSYGTLTYTVAGSTGKLIIQNSNSFDTINFSDVTNARTLSFTAGTTTTIRNAFNVNGTAGKLMTVNSTTGGTFFTLTKSTSGRVSCDYLSIQDSHVGGSASWFAGTHSTDVSGNTGWIFTAPTGIKKVSTVTTAQVKKINGVDLANVKVLSGVANS